VYCDGILLCIADVRQQCRNSKFVIFRAKLLKVLKCYNFLRVQRRHNCSPAGSFSNCVTTLYLLNVRLQMFLSIPIIKKFQILSCDTLVTNEPYVTCQVVPCVMCNTWLVKDIWSSPTTESSCHCLQNICTEIVARQTTMGWTISCSFATGMESAASDYS
jgi:hypothetical protein